eukprot:4380248-Pyramimonas_sp.AAC.2
MSARRHLQQVMTTTLRSRISNLQSAAITFTSPNSVTYPGQKALRYTNCARPGDLVGQPRGQRSSSCRMIGPRGGNMPRRLARLVYYAIITPP